MIDINELETALAAHGGADGADDALPPGFAEQLNNFRTTDAAARAAARKSHLDNAARLLEQLDSADNLVVKMNKRRVIKAELNAVKQIDALSAAPVE